MLQVDAIEVLGQRLGIMFVPNHGIPKKVFCHLLILEAYCLCLNEETYEVHSKNRGGICSNFHRFCVRKHRRMV